MNIHDFIEEFRSVIVASVGRDSNPLYHPGTDRKAIYQLIKEASRDGPSQARWTLLAESSRLSDSRDSAILVGEMGLGKTYISIAAAAALGFTKTLVVCPPHLVSKWRREVKQTIPLAHAVCGRRENRRPRKSPERKTAASLCDSFS